MQSFISDGQVLIPFDTSMDVIIKHHLSLFSSVAIHYSYSTVIIYVGTGSAISWE